MKVIKSASVAYTMSQLFQYTDFFNPMMVSKLFMSSSFSSMIDLKE